MIPWLATSWYRPANALGQALGVELVEGEDWPGKAGK